MTKKLDFTGEEFQRKELLITGPDGVDYLLRQASGGAAKRFRNERLARYIVGSDGRIIGMKDTYDLEPLLVHLCLFNLDKDGNPTVPVHQNKIESWGENVVEKLFQVAKDLNPELYSGVQEGQNLWKEALSHEDAPVTYENLSDFVNGLDDEFNDIKLLFKLSEEELAKNSPESMTDGSG